MTPQTQTKTEPKPDQMMENKVQHLRKLFADAPEIARTALEKLLPAMSKADVRPRVESAGKAGIRQGKVSELTMVVPFAPGGAQRLRAVLKALQGNFDAADR